MAATTIITVETNFCDYEQDPQVRKTFFDRWAIALENSAKVVIPNSTEIHFFLYMSNDKIRELDIIRKLLPSLNVDRDRTFHLVTFEHPEEGYGYDENTRPATLYKNPNKTAPYRDILFRKALENLNLEKYDRLIRVALDDDDMWLPWQAEEIVKAADQAYEPGKIVGVGFSQVCVAYIEKNTADIVELSHHMNGNKFYVSGKEEFDRSVNISPWSLPEVFDESSRRRLQRVGVTLKSYPSNIPGWVYGRWGSNLSTNKKTQYYKKLHTKVAFKDVSELIPKLAEEINLYYRRAPEAKSVHKTVANTHSARRGVNPKNHEGSEDFIFRLSQGLLPDGADAVAIFKFADGRPDVTVRIEPGRTYRTSAFAQLRQVNHNTVGFLQARFPDGTRYEISPRGRLLSLRYLESHLLEEFQDSPQQLDEATRGHIELGLNLSTWIVQYDPGKHYKSEEPLLQ